MSKLVILCLTLLVWACPLLAQDLRIATVTRPPFSHVEEGRDTGFSLELWEALAKDLGRDFEIVRFERFGDMLDAVKQGDADAAVANISITASREQVMDFSQPIFESGLQIMIPRGQSDVSLLRTLLSRDLVLAIIAAFGLLLGGGMLMWAFERRAQPYFDHPPRKAIFPAFWWALNLVVNGGFEERVPRTVFGRILGVFLVLSSLFIVSLFVAKITAVITVDAIQSSVRDVNDLYGKEVGTISGSTSAGFLDGRDLSYASFDDLDSLLAAFESRSIDAVVFDAPVLAYYTLNGGEGDAELVGPVFLRENYGVALPSGSALAEPINQSLLKLREDGTYQRIFRKWFGNTF